MSDVTVYITNHNNLERGFRQLVKWLVDTDQHVVVIDNASTYEPLLEWYRSTDTGVLAKHIGENLGPYAFWQLGWHKTEHRRFVVTDPDVVPSAECPHDLIAMMHRILDNPMLIGKVGPSLRIDNLPDHYTKKQEVITWEQQFWDRPVQGTAFYADIDTTFAMYEPGSEVRPAGECLRLMPPYSFEHIPWYEDSANPTAEHAYYHEHARKEWTHW